MSMLPRMFGSGLSPQGGDPFSAMQREMTRVFDEVFRGFPAMARGASQMGGFAPSLDVHETEQGLEITAELPGMAEEDVELRLEGDLVSLSGEKRSERADTSAQGARMSERSYGRFQRAFRLPFRPDPEQVRAEFDKGVLKITLPKPVEQGGGGRIPISRGGAQPSSGGINMGAPARSPDGGGTPPIAGGNASGGMNPGSAEFKRAEGG